MSLRTHYAYKLVRVRTTPTSLFEYALRLQACLSTHYAYKLVRLRTTPTSLFEYTLRLQACRKTAAIACVRARLRSCVHVCVCMRFVWMCARCVHVLVLVHWMRSRARALRTLHVHVCVCARVFVRIRVVK
jgi:hypothetical protein